MEKGFSKSEVIAQLTKSPHGDLKAYADVGLPAAMQQPEFFAHLISWNARKGQIRDSKAALPVIALATTAVPDFQENALAQLATLSPREFDKALSFQRTPGMKFATPRRVTRRLVERYLREKENNKFLWDKVAVQHRDLLARLYTMYHIKPSTDFQNVVLFGRTFKGVTVPQPKGTVFEAVAGLKLMPAQVLLETITRFKIPFLITKTALGNRATKETDVALAIINTMSPNELVNNTKTLTTWGITTNPALRAAYEDGLKRITDSTKVTTTTLKASKAAQVLAEAGEEDLAVKLEAVQEKKLAQIGVEGNWLVLADKSQSMQVAIETSRQVAAVLAKAVKGTVKLVFFDTSPRVFDVTGKTYEQIKDLTKHVEASGGTSIGCGLSWAEANNLDVDGIAVVSDAAENSYPYFYTAYESYAKKFDKRPTAYLYRCKSAIAGYRDTDLAASCKQHQVDLTEFDLQGGVDYYSLPNLVQTMRTNRYSLFDEIMDTPLLTLNAVLKNTIGMSVLTNGKLVTA
jgi:hypothetical protein